LETTNDAMEPPQQAPQQATDRLQRLDETFGRVLSRLEAARPFAKLRHQSGVLDVARRLLVEPGGVERLYELAPRLDEAGVFAGTDWDEPAALLPSLAGNTLESGDASLVVLECLSELRLLSIANGDSHHAGISAEGAQQYLAQLLALNLKRVFGGGDEASRVRLGPLEAGVNRVFDYLVSHIGFDDVLLSLVDEVWRLLAQRPLQVRHVRTMITQIAVALADGSAVVGEARLGADRLITAFFGPTQACLDDPGLPAYRDRLQSMDAGALQQEAYGFARSMHDTGLVSDYHVAYLNWLVAQGRQGLIANALGLSSTGSDALRCYQDLVLALIHEAVHTETAQAVYGLALLLERGLLYSPAIAPALWRQLTMPLSASNEALLRAAFGDGQTGRVQLLAGVLMLLGQPLGVGQGNNPTCQAARALSMWSLNDPDYLLNLVAQAAQHDNVVMEFEGQPLESGVLPPGLLRTPLFDTDPVSAVLVPHLDRIYLEMGRRCSDRSGDPHRWVNPEFHGWWVGRECLLAVDVPSGRLADYEAFLQRFYAAYHPGFNGNQPLIHPQPAGIAVTDSAGAFVGWHAITLLRVGLDQQQTMRVYFFNPNNDSGQHWGHGVVVSTHGHGERHGESSLPFAQLASRLYLYHDDRPASPLQTLPPVAEVAEAARLARESWAADR